MTLAIELGLQKFDTFMLPILNSIDCQGFRSYGNTFKVFFFSVKRKLNT